MADLAHNYILELHYTTVPSGMTPMDHVLRTYVYVDAELSPGEDFDTVGLLTRNNIDQTLEDLTDGMETALIPIWPATTTFNRWELWKQPVGTKNRTWIATKEIGEVGTNGTASRPAGQVTFTFRTSDGKYTKLYLMECSFAGNSTVQPPYSDVALALANEFKNSTNSYTTLYHARPIANIAYHVGENEELFKKRFRGG